MKNEWIFWVLLVVVVVLVSLYLRLYTTQTIAMFVSITGPGSANAIYPYQKIFVPINVTNTGGSAITNLVFSVVSNGNTSTTYQLTIPAGKSVRLMYNFTPANPGTYNISVIADPAKVYSIANRDNAHNSTKVIVTPAGAAATYALLPKGKIVSSGSSNLGRGGFIASSFLFSTYNISMFAPAGKNNAFVYSILNLTQLYVRNVSLSYANYKSGDYAYSVWIRGYLQPSVMGVAALGASYPETNYTLNGRTVVFAKISNSTTFCSWYDLGWIKSVVYKNSTNSCLRIYNGTLQTLNASLATTNATIYKRMIGLSNSTLLGNFTVQNNATMSYATLLVTGQQFIVPKIAINSTVAGKCYGVINSVNGTSFCSTYLLPSNGVIQGIGLVRTSAAIGQYNASVFSIVNNTQLFQALPVAISVIKGLNLSGSAKSFNSGFSNSCNFNNSLPCSSPSFLNGTLKFKIVNNLNKTIQVRTLQCKTSGFALNTLVNKTLVPLATLNLSTACFSLGRVITGIPVNLQLNILMNYSVANTIRSIAGNATVNVFS